MTQTTPEVERLGQPLRTIAYFSMEIGLVNEIPTYSGGLGMLAGDTIRSAADLQIPLLTMTLLHRRGYFTQRLNRDGWQQEEPVSWPVEQLLRHHDAEASVSIEGRTVKLRVWSYDVKGQSGFVVPVYFLDADVDGNTDADRALTNYLYGGEEHYRLCQEIILGIGGARMLRALGFNKVTRFHMNEGHPAFLTLQLLDEQRGGAQEDPITPEQLEAVRSQCVFTTHTPVPAGHDQFPTEMVLRVLGEHPLIKQMPEICCHDGKLNMTHLALNLSRYVNGVAKRHGEVSRSMFPEYPIDSITNGVHCVTWTAEPFQQLFDQYIPGWRDDNFNLRQALKIPHADVSEAHRSAKRSLLEYVNERTQAGMKDDALTIGFARRAATYKRADLLFFDAARLKQIVWDHGPLQIVFAGKAHPRDHEGKALIQRVIRSGLGVKDAIRFAYLENYDMNLGKLITAGVDIWLNNPQPPLEASGTSGMKAALNGVPSLSVLDGWWVEGHIEGVTGWAIGPGSARRERAKALAADARDLYDQLKKVMVLYYRHPERFVEIMRLTIALNGSFFNTQRMVQQYVLRAYFR